MNDLSSSSFSTRPTVVLDLPLKKHVRIPNPEAIILKIGSSYHDVGALCYAIRAPIKPRCRPREVVMSSFLIQRPKQVLQLITALSNLIVGGGRSIATVTGYSQGFKLFVDWADSAGFPDCLAGAESTRRCFSAWVENVKELYRRQEFREVSYNNRIGYIEEILEAMMGQGVIGNRVPRLRRRPTPNGSTEPLAPHDFAHAIALNQALFDGICDLVLEARSFPFKLLLPASLDWAENYLWVFPTNRWRMPPHEQGAERDKSIYGFWPYNYAEGRLSLPDEIAHRYAGPTPAKKLKSALLTIENAKKRMAAANADKFDWVRLMLAMTAHNCFLFLFYCYTGVNECVAREIETDGEVGVAALNQRYRSVKFRAGGKLTTVVVPVTFMPSLRKFMLLRKYLLGDRSFPYLFFTKGPSRSTKPKAAQIGIAALESLYNAVLSRIDPKLPRMASRKLRASVADWYQRNHDASVTAKVLQNSEATTQIHYDAGSATEHHDELSIFLTSVSKAAKRQRIVSVEEASSNPSLEEGGECNGFGHPEALANDVPVKPNCRDSQGCLFCIHRVLIASEEDARKVASAAFVMEQLILGPHHEKELRPLIEKCQEDLTKIAEFDNCGPMVEYVRNDVFEKGNLTPFFADKFQLFLELGVIL